VLFLLSKIIFILGLIRWLDEIEDPLVCAGIYTGAAFVVNLLFGFSFGTLLFLTVVRFGLATMYFHALHYLSGGPIYWLVAVVGFVIVLV